jgi:hypothetical protein
MTAAMAIALMSSSDGRMFISSRAAYDPREVVWVVVAACVGAAVGAGVGAAFVAVAGRPVKTSDADCDVPLTEATAAVDWPTAALLAITPYKLPNVSIENAPRASVIRFRLRVLTLLISFSLLRRGALAPRDTQASGPGLTFLWSGVKLLQRHRVIDLGLGKRWLNMDGASIVL